MRQSGSVKIASSPLGKTSSPSLSRKAFDGATNASGKAFPEVPKRPDKSKYTSNLAKGGGAVTNIVVPQKNTVIEETLPKIDCNTETQKVAGGGADLVASGVDDSRTAAKELPEPHNFVFIEDYQSPLVLSTLQRRSSGTESIESKQEKRAAKKDRHKFARKFGSLFQDNVDRGLIEAKLIKNGSLQSSTSSKKTDNILQSTFRNVARRNTAKINVDTGMSWANRSSGYSPDPKAEESTDITVESLEFMCRDKSAPKFEAAKTRDCMTDDKDAPKIRIAPQKHSKCNNHSCKHSQKFKGIQMYFEITDGSPKKLLLKGSVEAMSTGLVLSERHLKVTELMARDELRLRIFTFEKGVLTAAKGSTGMQHMIVDMLLVDLNVARKCTVDEDVRIVVSPDKLDYEFDRKDDFAVRVALKVRHLCTKKTEDTLVEEPPKPKKKQGRIRAETIKVAVNNAAFALNFLEYTEDDGPKLNVWQDDDKRVVKKPIITLNMDEFTLKTLPVTQLNEKYCLEIQAEGNVVQISADTQEIMDSWKHQLVV